MNYLCGFAYSLFICLDFMSLFIFVLIGNRLYTTLTHAVSMYRKLTIKQYSVIRCEKRSRLLNWHKHDVCIKKKKLNQRINTVYTYVCICGVERFEVPSLKREEPLIDRIVRLTVNRPTIIIKITLRNSKKK